MMDALHSGNGASTVFASLVLLASLFMLMIAASLRLRLDGDTRGSSRSGR